MIGPIHFVNVQLTNHSCNNAYTFTSELLDNLRNKSKLMRIYRMSPKIITYWVTCDSTNLIS